MKRIFTYILSLSLFMPAMVVWGQPWTYNFGTGNGSFTSGNSTSFLPSPSSGTARVRIGTGGGSINLNNPGTTLGTNTELQIVAATGTSTNKAGIYSWTSPSTTAYVRFLYRTTSSGNGNLNFSLGASALGSDNNGYTGSYNNALVSFTITYASGNISSVVRRASGNTTTITSHGFYKDTDQVVEVFGNNGSSSTTYYRAGTNYTLASQTWDLWVDGTRVVINGATAGSWGSSNNIEGFAFYAESSASNAASIYVDEIEYSPNLPSSSNHIFVWSGDFSASSNWNTRITPTGASNATINANVQITTNAEVNNLAVSSGNTVSIQSSGTLSVNGTLSNSGTLTLKSDATGTGSLIHSTSGVNATVERYVAGGWSAADAGWHLISSPVASQAISAFETSGAGNGYDFYGWNESNKLWMNYKDAGFSTWNGSSNFAVGRGYLISYEQTQSGKSFSGNLNVSDVSLSNLSYNPSQGNGWHLLGNPFASALAWNNGDWNLSNIAGTAKIWHSTNKSYSDIAANGIIPSAQGFFVQVTNATNSLTIPASARTHSSQAWYKNSTAPQLRLIARPADGSSAQETILRIEPGATEGNDPYWDSRFLAGYAPQLYSLADGVKLSTNALPSISEAMEIPLGFQKNQHNNFTLELSDNSLSAVVLLKDLKTGITHNLTQQPVYTFTSAEGDDPLRFKLAFASVGLEPAQQDLVPYAWYAFGMLHFRNVETGSWVEVYAANGQRVMREQFKGDAISLKVAPGVYMVKINEAKQQNIQKIVIF
ncbi:MAG: T9SS type A sorting domain-containing protein [Bacteroidales bacterium]|nr:T9SS type A sorting domain-containing protein [Bacteroidales bacterium]